MSKVGDTVVDVNAIDSWKDSKEENPEKNPETIPLNSSTVSNDVEVIVQTPMDSEKPTTLKNNLGNIFSRATDRARVSYHRISEQIRVKLPGSARVELTSTEGDPVKPNSRFKITAGENMSKFRQVTGCMRSNALTILSVLGVLSGGILAVILRYARDGRYTQREIAYVMFPGDLFLRMLKALIIPLIVSSLISAIGSLDLKMSGKIGARAVAYYMSTTCCAVVLGIILATSIRPGKGGNVDEISRPTQGARPTTTPDLLMDLVRNLFPPNLIQACIAQYKTVLVPPTDEQFLAAMNATEGPINKTAIPLSEWRMKYEIEPSTNILGLVVFALVLGITLGKMGPKGKPLLDLFSCLSEAFMIITSWVIHLSPIGVLFLVTAQMLEMESFEVIVGQLGMYFLTVMLGLFTHGFIVLTSMYFLITKRMPFQFIGNMAEALATAFATSSSTATVPVALACLEDKNGIDPRVTRFVMPIGATINMDGTALYEAVAALFIAQVRGISLTLGNIIAISITSTAASIGAAGIPQAGLVTMVMVLDTVGLPAEDVTLILAVDWFLDRFRTFTNVLGDSLGAGIVNHLSKKDLSEMPPPQQFVTIPPMANPDDFTLEMEKELNGMAVTTAERSQPAEDVWQSTSM
ncbi:hypothetical protein QYM36_007328 [Artemia franciscana]|uniref:Amino acid transporter n=2 Tax=Artemia franciscana TaxID=6661 RepID=A0AA88I887_ARTSF|nr:hypothetical protein QYM36_007328 [Artemia franciscana]KAK2717169.1 hypothetical protein QYM36_007328 [Artemia franciscana]KAK2717171.1 hypothetical protein QYM36_007328 [Artemia franciscana]